MYCPIKTADARVDHKKATAKTIKSNTIVNGPNGMSLNKSTQTAAMVMGKTQYPNTHTDWKNEMVPPNNWALTVTTADPSHTAQNTAAKTILACPIETDMYAAHQRPSTEWEYKYQTRNPNKIKPSPNADTENKNDQQSRTNRSLEREQDGQRQTHNEWSPQIPIL